jgi:hypothetical protein
MSKRTKNMAGYKKWHVIRSVVLDAPAAKVWNVIGGFYTIHEWHPDISKTEIPAKQTQTRQLQRILTLPGQPKTTEELVLMDNDDFYYQYKWYQGAWGEKVKNYQASLRVLSGDLDKICIVQWESMFEYPTDAISDFYWNGFRELEERFPIGKKK